MYAVLNQGTTALKMYSRLPSVPQKWSANIEVKLFKTLSSYSVLD